MAFAQEAVDRLTTEATAIIARYPQPRSALLPMLHLVQSEEGYVSPDGIALCAGLLGLTTAEVSAVATFYTQYKRHPNGEYTVGVCTNTLCAVMGGDVIFDSLEQHLGVGHDETTEDGKITLERVECNAACDYAPVVMVNWEFFDNQTPASAREVCDRIRDGRAVQPSRGANEVVTFKQMSHVLAGFDDGRANEGVGAGTPSQRGTVLAQQMGWRAPGGDSSAGGSEQTGGSEHTGRSEQTSRADTAAAATDAVRQDAQRSGNDAPAVPPGASERGGTTAGKPPGEATSGEADPGTGTEKG
jgi:NADH-quinone oxidoreductase subunit E